MENGNAEADQSWIEVSLYSTGALFSPVLSQQGPRVPPALFSALLEVLEEEEELELA